MEKDLTGLVLIVGFVILLIKMYLDKKAGYNSLEKKRIREIVDEACPDGKTYKALYAQYVQSSSGGGATTSRCYSYAVGFRPERPDELLVIPLFINKGEMIADTPVRFGADNIQKVKGSYLWITLFGPGPKAASNTTLNVFVDKDGFVLQVSDSNLKSREASSICPVNIQQKEVMDDWKSFVDGFIERYS